MPALVSRSREAAPNAVRKRRVHGKSRKGCGNCKLRRVKCDETRPRCSKCLAYGVSCSYDGSAPALDLSAQGSFQVDLSPSASKPPPTGSSIPTPSQSQSPPNPDEEFERTTPQSEIQRPTFPHSPVSPVSLNRSMAGMIDASLHAKRMTVGVGAAMAGSPFMGKVVGAGPGSSWTFTEADLETVTRFQERTVLTIGNRETSPTYRDCIGILSFSHPFLMHMLLGVTHLHDAHLYTPHAPAKASTHHHLALTHWNTATTLFNAILSQPLPPSSRDAVWATGALLGAAVFAYIESPAPESSWPLKTSDPTDLDWLKISEGKKAIWNIANPTRPDSMFSGLATCLNHLKLPSWATHPDISTLPSSIQNLFSITPTSTRQNSPYLFPTIILSRLQGLTPNHDNILDFLRFMAFMPVEFKILLECKDPRAMLLLLWWFRKLETGELWWVRERARVEGRAIEMYLERWCGGELMRACMRVGIDDWGKGEMGGGGEVGENGVQCPVQ
ncbi:hypothetical protein K458DRAFT_428515 [Lentithecium fluviatile CBS 122367]|uniref:Zn(2)-C6 fungal-type domain-containing protein n=1 Tax=Lentithecium fluviatile CBS 122367 TaxID=1168545 RepID=A0A6G1JAW2_9PLEO|nr:hypothetical protein K458DRAFT_428515 [Lentithecium fluviatile CBS 122367]